MLEISKLSLSKIHFAASNAYPEECCGLLLGRLLDHVISVVEVRTAPNIAETQRQNRYLLDPLTLLHADRDARTRGLDIVGFYHSHPDHPAEPSATDIDLAWEIYAYLIVTATPGGITAHRDWIFKNNIPHELPVHLTEP